MRSEIQEYINRVKDNDRSLTKIKITEGSLDGFEQLINVLKERAAIASQIIAIEVSEITDPLTLNLIILKNLRKLDLGSSAVESLYLPRNLEKIKISPDKCSPNVQNLINNLKLHNLCEISYDSDVNSSETGSVYSSDVKPYEDTCLDEEALSEEDAAPVKEILQKVSNLLFSEESLSGSKVTTVAQEQTKEQNHHQEANPKKKMRRMGSLGYI